MKRLSEFLTKNPVLVVVVFLLSLASTLVTLILGAKDIYRDYLSKSVAIPAWLVLLALVIILIGWVIYGSRSKLEDLRPLELVADQVFGVERVHIGGRRFVSCTFDGSELIIDGRIFDFDGCRFIGQRFVFDGAASQTIGILAGMYQDPPFRPLIDDLFARIKSGDLPHSEANGIPPNL
jgi:hypothetical protein